ncbi:non-heme iron oxygenase ferredoxin subunit [Glycomyces albidus]|uniref:Rieske 2Fe-2S domain-containing protein n=1 Tax=Glycomyces albidus TaxID=2656774 RepID=A0A6L5GG94_9ACTN|nr:non-heme iron oxygenase ferredoxin subunit [Glycomyces albidus]MQM28596.1 Rieske 2Fe-2S domain-containing protein [Glycomyces albidus]
MTDDDYLRVCALDELPDSEPVAADIHGTSIVLVRKSDEVYALYDECSHAAVALSEGDVDDCSIECWLHGSTFDLRTGKPSGPPATTPVPTYPVELRGGDVYLSLKPKTTETAAEPVTGSHATPEGNQQ